MKVAIVVHRFPQLSETFIINQITALIDAGIDVQIFSYYRPDPAQKLHPQFIEYKLQERIHYGVYLPISSLKKYTDFLQLLLQLAVSKNKLKLLKSLNFVRYGRKSLNLQYFYRASLFSDLNSFDIIHCHFGPIGDDIVQLKRMGIVQGKVITSFHGYDYQLPDVLREYNHYKSLFSYGDGFIANSTFTYHRLLALGCNPDRLQIVPVSAASKVFDIQVKRKNLVKNRFRIITVARLEEVKGIEYAIKAMYTLKYHHLIEITYDIIGNGSLYQELNKLAKDLNLDGVVNFLGSKLQDEVKAALLDSDVFLLSSITTRFGASEAQGLVLIEAQSAGLPVVASRSGGIPDSTIDGETGILVSEKDPEEIASAIFQLYKNREQRIRMGERGGFLLMKILTRRS